MTAVLITGGAGFIGSTLADRLLARCLDVVCFDNFNSYYAPELKRANVAGAVAAGGRLVEGDICDGESFQQLLFDVRPLAVVHLAARAGVRPSLEHPQLYVDTNVHGTLNVLRACEAAGVGQVVFASSSSVYGHVTGSASETSTLCRPLSPYGASKVAGEAMCSAYTQWFDSVTALRFFTVYGPRQRPDMAISKFVRQIESGETVTLFGDGSTSRDYTFVEDIVDGIEAAIDSRLPGYNAFNLGHGEAVVLKDLVELLEELLGRRADVRHVPTASTDPDRTLADISLARKMLGYSPRVSVEEGAARYLEWINRNTPQESITGG